MDEDKSIILIKVLNTFIKKEFPGVKEFYVNCDEFDNYEIGINMKYNDLQLIDDHKIKKEIESLSKMILTTPKEKLIRIFFY